jgi:hypothetical protein
MSQLVVRARGPATRPASDEQTETKSELFGRAQGYDYEIGGHPGRVWIRPEI